MSRKRFAAYTAARESWQPVKMLALWWWIDRWRKSTAYMDMTLEQQGGYRNLLDEACLRGGPLPNNERVLAKACGDVKAWRKIRPVVMARFTLIGDGWRNETLDEVLKRTEAIRQDRSESGRLGAEKRWQNHSKRDGKHYGKQIANGMAPSPSPSPSPDQDPDPDQKKSLSSADADFDAFRQAYPVSRRVGGKPGKEAFKRSGIGRHGDSLATVLLALEQQKRSEQWQNPKLIPLMTTWLNQERWIQVLPEVGGNGQVSDQTRANLAARDAVIAKLKDRHDA